MRDCTRSVGLMWARQLTRVATGALLLTLSCALASESARAETPNRMPLEVLEPPGRAVLADVPVSVGVVFPEKTFAASDSARVVDDLGEVVPLDTEVTGWWDPEHRHVKWLLLKFPVTTDRQYWLEYPVQPASGTAQPIASQVDGAIKVDTGRLQAEFRASASPLPRIVLDGQELLAADAASHRLVLDPAATEVTLGPMDWKIETATPRRATIRGLAFFQGKEAKRLAQLDLRLEFFKNESFVRIYHTLVWMIRDPAIGAREISLRLHPKLESGGELSVGIDGNKTGDAWRDAWTTESRFCFLQSDVDCLSLLKDDQETQQARRLKGWLRMTGKDGRGLGISLRDAWQTYPKAFSLEDGKLGVELWPARGEPMGFGLEHIVPESLYHKKEWERYNWSKEAKHALHEYEANPAFEHTAEGAARTHELTLFFFDRSSKRSHAEIQSLTQQPVIVRQDPAAAMKVPLMGFSLSPVDQQAYPRMEEAVDALGRMTLARWEDLHDHGFWRFGMIRWGSPPLADASSGIYRWFDGVQYDLQLIPWILFMRGGSRDFYVEGERVGRYAMDVCTNHFNTRGAAPGYQGGAAISPFPWHSHHLHKSLKIHFLQYHYHLTGYPRAKDVMDEVIAGAIWAAEHHTRQPDDPYYRGRGREHYNVGRFWVSAYDETFDPKCRNFARQWLDVTLNREYNAALGNFRSPGIYLSGELAQQSRLWPNDAKFRSVLLEYLDNMGMPEMPDGGVRFTNRVMLCDPAYRLTGDRRYAEVAFDVARSLADLVPEVDASSGISPQIPFSGNGYFRWRLGPILIGLSQGRSIGLLNDQPHLSHDTHIGFPADDKPQVCFRPASDGDLKMKVILRETWNAEFPPVTISVIGAASEPASLLIPGQGRPATVDRVLSLDTRWRSAEFTVKDVQKGKTYGLHFEGGNSNVGALVLADAQVVHRLAIGQPTALQNHAGQYHSGGRVFLKTNADKVTVHNFRGLPLSIRDATTWELLYTSPLPVPAETEHQLGKDRLIAIVVASSRNWLKITSGVHPWVAANRESWFVPDGQ